MLIIYLDMVFNYNNKKKYLLGAKGENKKGKLNLTFFVSIKKIF